MVERHDVHLLVVQRRDLNLLVGVRTHQREQNLGELSVVVGVEFEHAWFLRQNLLEFTLNKKSQPKGKERRNVKLTSLVSAAMEERHLHARLSSRWT